MKTADTLFGFVRRICALLLGTLLFSVLFAPFLFANDATDLLRQLAERGDARAQTYLGMSYKLGHGIPQDNRQAVYWYRRAAEQGEVTAQAELGGMYKDGRGIPQDDRQAVFWFRKAAEQGDANAQYDLGTMYYDGRGVPQDDRQAVYWYRKAADQGNDVAQYGLCVLNFRWCGLRKEEDKCQQARYWCQMAGSQGIAGAYSTLGTMYEKGIGVPKDMRQAKVYYRKAAALGDIEAQEALRELESGIAGSLSSAPATMQSGAVEQACVFIASNGSKGLASGTGFFVAPGYVVTNAHVVAGASDVLVTGKAMRGPTLAEVVATSRSGERDYAVLRLDPADCGNACLLAFAAEPNRADRVGAWGFPGLINRNDPNFHRFLDGDFSAMPTISYTEGVVSAVLERNPAMIVHTAPLSGGNSGGPLVNASGDVVGINTQISLDDASYRQASIALSGRDLLQFLRNNGIPAQSR